MGLEWWIFAASCAAVAWWLLHRRRQRRLAAISRFEHCVTPDLVEKILAEPLPPAELRDVSILNTNLTGYVPFCETAGDDEAAAAINRHRSILVPIVRQHRGLISDFVGDGTLCLFGAPKPDPQHAVLAVTAALELLRAHQAMIDKLSARGLPPLPLRVGIATGRVLVGDLGHDATYGASGDAVTDAARLQEACKELDVGILICGRTAERVAGAFELRRVMLPRDFSTGEFAFEALRALPQAQPLA